MTIVRQGTKLNVPASWQGMSFTARMDYLVETHQVKDHKAARAVLMRPKLVLTDMRYTNAIARMPYVDN